MNKKNREELEEELKIYRDRLEKAMDAGNLAWWEMELPSGEVEFNDRKAEMLGYSPDEFTHYEDFTDLLHPEDHDRAMKAMRDHLEGKEPRYEVEYRIEKKDGDYKWFRDVGGITEENGDGEYKKVTGVVIDIDERKEAEEKIRFRAGILDQVENAIIATDPDGKIVYWNKKAEEYYGWESDEVFGKNIMDVTSIFSSKERAEEVMEILRRGETWSDEFEVKRKDGTEFPAIVTNAPLYDEDGNMIGIVGVTTDITERKKVEEREEFLHSLLRHDVRNKLQIAKGYFELLEDFDLPEEAEEYIDKSEKSIDEADNITQKVRKLRRIDQEEEIGELNLAVIIESVIDEHRDQLSEKGIDIEKENLEAKVLGGPLLEELFSNLMENSIRHSNCDLINISAGEENGECVVTFEDNGKGIPDEHKENVFEKGHKMGKTAGSGLGMFVVQRVAEVYNGTVEVKDSELGGARFDVRLKKA